MEAGGSQCKFYWRLLCTRPVCALHIIIPGGIHALYVRIANYVKTLTTLTPILQMAELGP